METNDVTLRHLLDLCRKSEKTGTWQYSGFLSPAEQDDLLTSREAAGFPYFLDGGYENAERNSLVGDIIVRDRRAWFFCLASAADMLASSLAQVRRTAVAAEITTADVPELQPRYAPVRLNVASERLDAVISAFAGISRGQADKLFAAGKVFVNGRMTEDRSTRLKEGDVLSVRGIGKAVYDGIEYETKKKRYQVRLRKLV